MGFHITQIRNNIIIYRENGKKPLIYKQSTKNIYKKKKNVKVQAAISWNTPVIERDFSVISRNFYHLTGKFQESLNFDSRYFRVLREKGHT